MSRAIFAGLLLLVALGAGAFRCPQLEQRPMHADEAVQAVRFRQLWLEGGYRYDPHEFHGPTLSYATLPSAWLSSAEDFGDTTATMYRIVPALFGVCLIFLLGWLADALGKPATLAAAVLVAISPAMVYYSRYYIHETLLVFFSLAAIGAGWRYYRTRRFGWCLACGVLVGMMQATKETAALAYLAALVATGLTMLWSGLGSAASAGERDPSNDEAERPGRPRAPAGWPPLPHLAGFGIAAVATAALWLSSFGSNPLGPLDGVLTYLPWLDRAAGASPHIQPWSFYWRRLGWWRLADGPRWSEGLILILAAVGVLFALAASWRWPARGKHACGSIGSAPAHCDGRRRAAAQGKVLCWLSWYTLALAAGYSVIPYKTPWCVLQFLIGLILLAGFGAVACVRATPTRPLKALLLLVLIGFAAQLGWQAHRAAFRLPTDPANPWVYAHTLPDIQRLGETVEELVSAVPTGRATPVKVVWDGPYYWPLPWYLRQLEHVELWTAVPDDAQAPLVISSPKHDAALTAQLDETHLMTGYYGVRPNVLVQLWVRMDVWEAHLRRLGRL